MAKIGELAMAVGRKVLNELPNKKYWNGCAKFEDGRVIYDKDVYDFVVKHMRFRDRINTRKIVEAALASFAMLEGAAGKPLNEDWNFKW